MRSAGRWKRWRNRCSCSRPPTSRSLRRSASVCKRTGSSGPEHGRTHATPWADPRGVLRFDDRRRHPQPVPLRARGPRRALLHPGVAGICARPHHEVLRDDHRARPAAGAPLRATASSGRSRGRSLAHHRLGSHLDPEPPAVGTHDAGGIGGDTALRITPRHPPSPPERPIPSEDMDLSSKVLREVEFRDRLRGYDTDEVDEFLEKVAVAVDEMQEKMQQLTNRAERAERSASERAADEDDDSIRRTLVLAQRTADLAVKEAQDQATAMTESARAEADKMVAEARENAQRIASEAERRHRDEVARLENQRDQVRGELTALSAVLDAERRRLGEALNEALRFVERTLTPSPEFSE